MKTYRTILLATLALLAVSCEKDPDPQIAVPESIVLGVDAVITTFDVSSNVAWTMTVSDPWFKITPKHGNGKTNVKIGVERNTTGAARNAVLEFAYGNGTIVRVPVSQAAYVVEMDIKSPTSVTVEKGKQLILNIKSNTNDWSYSLVDGNWLKEVSKDEKTLVFDLDPSVKFDVEKPAVITFTSPSDPIFSQSVEVLPLDFVQFSATAPESVEVKKDSQFSVEITSNIEDWTYTITDGAWMSEASRTATQIIFNLDPGKLTSVDVAAKITFSSLSYASLSKTIEIQPISNEPIQIMADKSKMRAFVLENDGVIQIDSNVATEYLFDGKWMSAKNDYSPVNYKSFALNTTDTQSAEGHGDSFTIDAGESMRLAKFISYHYWNYSSNCPLIYEIYAYTGSGEPEADWSNWKLLGKVDVTDIYAVVKELPDGSYSENIANGDILEIPASESIEARYYRFKMLLNGFAYGKSEVHQYWSGRTHWLSLAEVSLYKYE